MLTELRNREEEARKIILDIVSYIIEDHPELSEELEESDHAHDLYESQRREEFRQAWIQRGKLKVKVIKYIRTCHEDKELDFLVKTSSIISFVEDGRSKYGTLKDWLTSIANIASKDPANLEEDNLKRKAAEISSWFLIDLRSRETPAEDLGSFGAQRLVGGDGRS